MSNNNPLFFCCLTKTYLAGDLNPLLSTTILIYSDPMGFLRTATMREPLSYWNIVSWEPEGRYQYSKIFRWVPQGCYCCSKSMVILAPFWLSTDDTKSVVKQSGFQNLVLWLLTLSWVGRCTGRGCRYRAMFSSHLLPMGGGGGGTESSLNNGYPPNFIVWFNLAPCLPGYIKNLVLISQNFCLRQACFKKYWYM